MYGALKSRSALYMAGFGAGIVAWLCIAYNLLFGEYARRVMREIPQEFLEKAGTLGDSFGSFSSLMAVLAAVGAILSLREQRKSSRTDVFASTFTALMDRLQQTIQDTAYYVIEYREDEGVELERLVASRTGQAAFLDLAQELRQLIIEDLSDELSQEQCFGLMIMTYISFYEKYQDDLGHYFRQVYHILSFIDESEEESSARFIKFLRASLSNSQLLLIAYNVACGEGMVKFADLVEKHSFLHNIRLDRTNLGKAEKDLIESRLGCKAMRSDTEGVDKLRKGYIVRSAKNIKSKDSFREYLMLSGRSADWGVPWYDL